MCAVFLQKEHYLCFETTTLKMMCRFMINLSLDIRALKIDGTKINESFSQSQIFQIYKTSIFDVKYLY
ncbi:hypothetical protein FHX64_001726 [Microbacter margulisiae]|uniref:Uncharacterized protein n=1 Tax=Microbacter margulisiae TaxID=1350067 RepID=A0A7W5H1G7_9PORP|nr:hypothetical protein [Microbacter margulisiae]